MLKHIPLFAMLHFNLHAQQKTAFNPKDIAIEWQFLNNNFNKENKTAGILKLSNTSKTGALPANGWVIYFNAVRGIASKNLGYGLEASKLTGDLFVLRPTPSFKGLPVGASVELSYISSDWIFNYTEAPMGFYFVWDDAPSVAIPITHTSIVNKAGADKFSITPDDTPGNITPSVVFNLNSDTRDITASSLPEIFPTPVSYKKMDGTYLLTAKTSIWADNRFAMEKKHLSETLAQFLVKSATPAKKGPGICLVYNAALDKEAYSIEINAKGITLKAAQPAGIFYGIQSLKCLFPLAAWKQPVKEMLLPQAVITDQPRFGYRGLHIDVARNFQTKEQLFKMLNWMAMYKLNVLHLHFCDDEGWRIEIPGLTELTTIGVKRSHTQSYATAIQPTYGSGGLLNKRQSGYYTKQDYIDILKFARNLHIEVIPEIETPGHARAAVVAMKYRYAQLSKQGKEQEALLYLLHDVSDSSSYHSIQNYSDNVMCVGLPSVYRFIEKVVDELIAMHRQAGCPLKTIHMGGDEVPAGVWEKSPACNAVIQSSNEYKDAADLWVYYWQKIDKILAKRGLTVSGWEEIGMHKRTINNQAMMVVNPAFTASNFNTYVWNNVVGFGSEDLPYKLANAGYRVVLCPVSNLYFDLAYQRDFDEPGYYWGGFVDTDKPFDFIPFDYYKNTRYDRMGNTILPSLLAGKERLTDYGKKNITGIQGHLWSENITTAAQLEYMAFPKLLGLAERAWAPDPEWANTQDSAKSKNEYQVAWSSFANVVGKRELFKLSYYQGGAYFRVPKPGAKIENGAVLANIQLPGLIIRYTKDGTIPTIKSAAYKAPITAKGIITLRAFDVKERGGKAIALENQ